jgi:hypothetical protein
MAVNAIVQETGITAGLFSQMRTEISNEILMKRYYVFMRQKIMALKQHFEAVQEYGII